MTARLAALPPTRRFADVLTPPAPALLRCAACHEPADSVRVCSCGALVHASCRSAAPCHHDADRGAVQAVADWTALALGVGLTVAVVAHFVACLA